MRRLASFLGFFGIAIRQCAWCRCFLGLKRGQWMTHGICRVCSASMLDA